MTPMPVVFDFNVWGLLQTLALFAGGAWAVWKFTFNHIEHMRLEAQETEKRILARLDQLQLDIRELRAYVLPYKADR